MGRGCWAGPLLVIAARQHAKLPQALRDSKLLSPKQRASLIKPIQEACDIGEGWVAPNEIDNLGLTQAMKLAVERALEQLFAQPNERIIIDGNFNYCSPKYINVQTMIKADQFVPVVSAASVMAKVLRDQYMVKAAQRHPEYGFEQHVGYGTAGHRMALQKLGICELHRQSYRPVQAFR